MSSETPVVDVADPARRRGWVPALATILGTVLVVVLEFALLSAVYVRSHPIRAQRVAVADLAGRIEGTTSTGWRHGGPAGADASLAAIRHSGVSAATVERLTSSVHAAEVSPDAATVGHAVDQVHGVWDSLGARERRIDLEAELFYIVLLAFATFGWGIWFRRLVAKHRSLERAVTENEARAEGERRLAQLVRNSADVILSCDRDHVVTYATPSIRQMLGVSEDSIVGRTFVSLFDADDAELLAHALAGRHVDQAALRMRLRHADGRQLLVEVAINNLLDADDVAAVVLTLRDVTRQVELQEQLTHQAFHDSLTGLANRQLFTDRLAHALLKREGIDQPMVVLICDLDDFKNVNDSIGHGIGDEILATVGERVRSMTRSGDTAARLGGDEFAMLIENIDVAEARKVAERMLARLSEPMVVSGQSMTIRASIGLAQALPGEMTSAEALRNADVAMYLAKSRGKSNVALYESRLHAEALERLQLRAELQRAIKNDELVLYYQPTIDLATGRLGGFEALVRWQHPVRGFMPPGLFIPMAEESGLIAPLGSWVLREACRTAMLLKDDQHEPSIAVNVAAQQLADPKFVDEVVTVLTETGLPSRRLTLEITESVVMTDLADLVPRLEALRALGIRIAIDDFGTGYSSLSYLSQLPLDVLKIDKSFVDRITLDRQDAQLTLSILQMSQTMNLLTVAEGVEEDGQADWLVDAECTYGQGFLWSKPVPVEQARALIGVQLFTPRPAAVLPLVEKGTPLL